MDNINSFVLSTGSDQYNVYNTSFPRRGLGRKGERTILCRRTRVSQQNPLGTILDLQKWLVRIQQDLRTTASAPFIIKKWK